MRTPYVCLISNDMQNLWLAHLMAAANWKGLMQWVNTKMDLWSVHWAVRSCFLCLLPLIVLIVESYIRLYSYNAPLILAILKCQNRVIRVLRLGFSSRDPDAK